MESFVDLGRGAGLHPVDFVLLSIDNGLPLVHFILFGVHDMLPAVDLRLLECLLGLQLIPDEQVYVYDVKRLT